MQHGAPTDLNGSPLVERHHHLRSLDGILNSCRLGSGGFVLVEGSFGTGKTSLLKAVGDRAAREGFTVLHARGSELETGFLFGMVRQLSENWLASAAPEERGAVLSGPAAAAAPLFDYDGGRVTGGTGEAEEPLLLGLHHMLVNISRRRPVLLLMDDLHWADAPSLRLLRSLADRLASHRIVCCATTVPARGDEPREATRALLDSPAVARLSVGPLSKAGVLEYLRSAVGAVPGDSAAACHDATAGNPFLLRELVGELRKSSGPDTAFCDPARIARTGPATVARTAARWIQHAPRGHGTRAGALAQALAVLGSSDDLAQLAGVAMLDRAESEDAVRALRDIGLVEPDEPLRYVAPVVRRAVYDHLPQTFRYRAHDMAARILAESGAPPQRVAEHVLHAPPGKGGHFTEILISAGQAALGKGEHAAAAALFRRAMWGPVTAASLPSLLAELGEAELRTGDPQAIDHLRRAMELTSDPIAHAAIALKLSGVLSTVVHYREALRVLRSAHAKVAGRHGGTAERLIAEIARITRLLPAIRPLVDAPPPGSRTAALTPLAKAEATYQVLAQRAYNAVRHGERAEHVLRLCDEALARRTPISEAIGGARAPLLIAFCLTNCGRMAEAGAVLDDAIQETESLGDTLASNGLRALRGFVNSTRGMLAEAETDATATLRHAVPGDAPSLGEPYAVLALVTLNVQRNQIDVAERVIKRYGRVQETPRQALFLPLLLARGELLMAKGEVEAAIRDFLRVRAQLREWGAKGLALSPAGQAVHGLAALGRFEEARHLAADFLADARAFGSPTLIASALCAAARTAEGPRSLALLAEAVQVLEGSAALPLRCSALLQYGSALRAAGQTPQARRRLRAADELAVAMGATRLSDLAREELAALGGRVGSSIRTGVAALTPRERRVSALATEGKRNQEIANILFVTVKTVEWHLSQVYRKLDITSREELRDALARTDGGERGRAGVTAGDGPGSAGGSAPADSCHAQERRLAVATSRGRAHEMVSPGLSASSPTSRPRESDPR
jgi:DNA-binding CsgD family transcriptional regulator/tetratricopeptide (TPR) repeat protein